MKSVVSATSIKTPRWHLVYYLLAAFDIVAISFSIFLNHLIMQEFSHSIDINRQWSDRLGAYTELGIRATNLNGPGNDVFNTGDTIGERQRMNTYFTDTQNSIQKATELSVSDTGLHIPEDIPVSLTLFQEEIISLADQARHVFDALEQQDNQTAGEHMARMDNHFSNAFVHVARLQTIANSEQTRLLNIDQEKAKYFQRYELVVAACIAIMVLAVTIYGHFLAQRLRRDQKIKRELLAQTQSNEKTIQQQLHQLEEASQAKDDFLANISHEIRTPMNGVIGAAELMKDVIETKEQKEYTNVIHQSASSLLLLINDLLDLSKIESGQLDIANESFDLEQLLKETTHLLQERARQKKLSLQLNFDEKLTSWFLGDANRIRQILINLVGNAIKFTDHGEVLVSCSVKGTVSGSSHIVIGVSDTGIGIKPEHQENLFSRFTQADSSITRRFGGTGLGLSISRQLAVLMDGDLEMTSTFGKGSSFELILDLPRSERPKIKKTDDNFVRNYNAFVLLVEDNSVNQLVISGLLKRLGIVVDIANDGVEALEKCEINTYDLIFMDMQMPNMDGVTATKEIRKMQPPSSDTIIIAMTANASAQDRELCFGSGMNYFISKPVEMKMLIDTLDDAIPSPASSSAEDLGSRPNLDPRANTSP